MQNCWDENPLRRPSFEEIAADIERVVVSAQTPNFSPVSCAPHLYTNTTSSNMAAVGGLDEQSTTLDPLLR